MTELFVLLVEDRHTGPNAWAYSTEERANDALDEWVDSAASHPEDVEDEELNAAQIEDGVVRCVRYSVEDDCASIVRRTVDAD
jgi:hypothetical protein